jgi:hypothetical protein
MGKGQLFGLLEIGLTQGDATLFEVKKPDVGHQHGNQFRIVAIGRLVEKVGELGDGVLSPLKVSPFSRLHGEDYGLFVHLMGLECR